MSSYQKFYHSFKTKRCLPPIKLFENQSSYSRVNSLSLKAKCQFDYQFFPNQQRERRMSEPQFYITTVKGNKGLREKGREKMK